METIIDAKHDEKGIGFKAFIPLIIFLALYIGSGVYFTAINSQDPFSKFPRHIALIIAIGISLIMYRRTTISKKLDILCKNMGNKTVMMLVLIYLLAGAFQSGAASMGGKESIVNFSLTHIPSNLMVPGIFIMGAFISTAIGTSMGTIAALAPVAIDVAQGANLNLPLTCAAIIGGAYFGDNLSMISDTTISATQCVGAEMKDKFRMNFFIAMPAAIIATIAYGLSNTASINKAFSYNFIEIMPYIIVIILALLGMNVVFVLLLGTISTGMIGIIQGKITFFTWIQALSEGMSNVFDISLVAILISGIIGIVRYYGGVQWLINSITSHIHTRRGAEYGISFLSGILSATLLNNTIGIIISSSMAKDIGKKYNIAPKRLASLLDIFACAFLSLMPHDTGMLIVAGLAGVSPIAVLQYSFYTFALILVTVITIQFGLFKSEIEKRN